MTRLTDRPVRELLAEFASTAPTPGGGSAAALTVSVAFALLTMVARMVPHSLFTIVAMTKREALSHSRELDKLEKSLGGIKDMADGNFIIPQMGIIRSLNISVACAVSLYEAFRQKQNAGHYASQKLSETEYKQLSNEWGLYGEEISL